VTINPLNGWTAPVSLDVSGLPSDATSNFDPNPVQPTRSSTLSISTSRSGGQFDFVIVGNGEGRQHTALANLIVQPSQQAQLDFSIDLLVPARNSYSVGDTPQLWARVWNTGAAMIGAYDLEAQFSVVSPSGATIAAGAGWNGYDIPSSGVHVIENTDNPWTIPTNAEPGLYTLRVTISSRSSGSSRSGQLGNAFSIGAPAAPDFALSISPTSEVITQGESTTFTITVTSSNGWTTPVSLSVSGLPDDATSRLSSNPITPTGTSALYVAASVRTGRFVLVIVGDGGGRQHTTSATLIVEPSQQPEFDFGISASQSSVTVRGGKAVDACTVTLSLISGSSGRVDLSLSGLPSAVGTHSFSPPYDNPPFTSTLSIGTFSGAPTGDYTLTIVGSGGGKTHSTTFKLTVNPSGSSEKLSVSISADHSSGSAPLTVSFSSQVTGGTPAYSYSWNFGDGRSSVESNPTHTFSKEGSYSAVLTVTDVNGQTAPSNAIDVVVNSTPSSSTIVITNLKISGSGDARPAFITVSFTVTNQASSPVNVNVRIQKDCTFSCTMLDDQQVNLSAHEAKVLSKTFTETVTGQHVIIVSIYSSIGTLLTSASGEYVVGPITPGGEELVIFIPDPFDASTGKLQIQHPDGSITEIRVKKVRVEVTHTSEQSYQLFSTLRVYSYVPVPPALCVAKAVSPIPLSLDDMIQMGFVTLAEDVIKEVTGVAVPVSEIVTAVQVVQCLYGTEDKVEVLENWKFGQPQTLYFALDRNAKLEAEYQYFPLLTTYPVTETGQWHGTIDQTTDLIIINVGGTTSSQSPQPFTIGDLSVSANPTTIGTSDFTTVTATYSIQTYLPIDLTVTLEVWEDTHTFGLLDKRLCSLSPSADANQATCSVRGSDLGFILQAGNHDLFARLIVNWHSLDNNEPRQTKKESQRVTVSVGGSWPFGFSDNTMALSLVNHDRKTREPSLKLV
jgi:PKD repeat protein